jgi:hypothetical protein
LTARAGVACRDDILGSAHITIIDICYNSIEGRQRVDVGKGVLAT